MDQSPEESLNQAAYQRLRVSLCARYPHGTFVAIAGGNIVADGGSFDELEIALDKMGFDSPDVLVVQAGVHYPENATIFNLLNP